MIASEGPVYDERVSSTGTEALFVSLALLFFWLRVRRVRSVGLDRRAVIFSFLSGLFLFYALNYRTLVICLTPDALKLTFGLFSWTIALKDIEACQLDELPVWLRLGGAGIHFMMVRRRYRVSFNFLEHSRIVIALKRRAGPVRDVSFSTRRPDDVLQLIREAVSSRTAD